jgi:hypothetical protein
MTDKKWTGLHTGGLLAITIVIGLIGYLFPPIARGWAWLGTLILLALFAAVVGHGITGLWRGLLIDERNKMSLSRLQMILWTIIVLSGFLIAGLLNVRIGQDKPLSISIPVELWILMGISTTSLVGSPLILSNKKNKPINEQEKNRTFALMERQGVDANRLANKGQVVVNNLPEDAQLSDLFKGDEIGNAAQVDMAKIQMFYFTLIIVLVYAIALCKLLAGGTAIHFFPPLDESMVALLGISHAGYLTSKATTHSETR